MASLSQWLALYEWHRSANGLLYMNGITKPMACFIRMASLSQWLALYEWHR